MANKRLSLTDIQLIHRLVNEYGMTQAETALTVGCTQSAVCKALKKPLTHIEEAISLSDIRPMYDGCCRTTWHDSDEEGLQVYMQSVSPYDDPTFQAVSDMELMDKYGYLIEED